MSSSAPTNAIKWSNIPQGPEDGIFKITRLHRECTDPKKVSLGVGAYRDGDGKPLVLEAVVRAKAMLASQPPQSWTHEYQQISGHAGFLSASQDLVFGEAMRQSLSTRLASIQSLGGTGACRLACDFIAKFVGSNGTVYLPNPTWGNHKAIVSASGLAAKDYRYIDTRNAQTPVLDFAGLTADLGEAPSGSAVLLHLCAHNPTGVDPSPDQWVKIAQLCKDRNLIPFFDNAYQGFASGNLSADAAPLRAFIRLGLNPFIACSFSKNMGLYGERVGVLHIVTPDAASASAALSQIKIIARGTYSNPPQFGAQVAHLVMTDPNLRNIWERELESMSARIRSMRIALKNRLDEMAPSQSWDHITNQIGMFSYSGLTKEQVDHCANHWALFMLPTGRMSMAGLNENNIDHVAMAIASSINDHMVENSCPVSQ